MNLFEFVFVPAPVWRNKRMKQNLLCWGYALVLAQKVEQDQARLKKEKSHFEKYFHAECHQTWKELM